MRLLLALVVGLLIVSASGVTALLFAEPCNEIQVAATDDGACPPTCVTCGCCAQAAEPALISLPPSSAPADAASPAPLPRLPHTNPRDILHVPKGRA